MSLLNGQTLSMAMGNDSFRVWLDGDADAHQYLRSADYVMAEDPSAGIAFKSPYIYN